MNNPTPLRSTFLGHIGIASANITPPIGIFARNWGAAASDVAIGIHRALTATTLTLQTAPDTAPLVLVALDLGWWRTAADEWELRGAVLGALQLDESRLIIALSHTHAGPGLCREDRALPGGELVGPYLDSVRDAVLETARTALSSAQRGALEWHYGRCDLAANRDLRDEGKPRFVCGFNPDGEADDTLLIGRVVNDQGKSLATIVNYACHPTTLAWDNLLISPDYIGAMREVIEANTGGLCLFLNGASGELAPPEQYSGDTALADRHGRRLGFAVLSTLHTMTPPHTALHFAGIVESGAPLAVWKAELVTVDRAATRLEAIQATVELPLKEMAPAADIAREMEACEDRVMGERLRRRWRVRRSVGDGTSSAEKLWGWRIGEALIFAQRNEAYSNLQRQLRTDHSGRAIAVLNLANGAVGYLPPAPFYDEDVYPVWQSPYERGGLEILQKRVDEMVGELLVG